MPDRKESKHRCPGCGRRLAVETETYAGASRVWVFCHYGPCPSAFSNEGAEGLDVSRAVMALQFLVEEEMKSINWNNLLPI